VVIEQLIADAANVTVQTLLEHILKNTGLLTQVVNSIDKYNELQIITALFDFVKEETRRNPSLQLKDLVNTIELMQKEGIALPFVQISGSDKGVNLLTAHGSKGLEFKQVFLRDVTAAVGKRNASPAVVTACPIPCLLRSLPPLGEAGRGPMMRNYGDCST